MKKYIKYASVILVGAALVAGAAFLPFERFFPALTPTESETAPVIETEAVVTTEATEPPETEPPYEAGTVYGNIFLTRKSDASLKGLSPEEAFYELNALSSAILSRSIQIRGTDPASGYMTLRGKRNAKDLGITLDREGAKELIARYVLQGTQEEMKAQAEELDQLDPVYLSDCLLVDEERFLASVSTLLPEEKEAVEAGYTIDPNSGQATLLSEDEDGYAYQKAAALEDLSWLVGHWAEGGKREALLDVNGGPVKAVVTGEDVHNFAVLGDYTTTFDTNAGERNKNLLACVTHMNGTVVAPGQICSALDMYGEVTEENGFVGAPTMIGGQHVLDIGGGMCQPTSTLYNALLLAEMEIIYRSNHSMYVNYGGPSRDAMVYAKNGSDFRFRNCKDTPVIVVSSIDLQKGSLNVKILGKEERPKDHQIAFRWETWDYVMPVVTRTVDPTAPIGYTGYERKVINTNEQWPQCGFKSNLYKVTTEGGQSFETLINKNDVYHPANSDFLCAPDFTVVVKFNPDSPLTAYLDVYYAWLDGTPSNVNIGKWKSADIRAFNERMKSLMAAEGFVWPYSGTKPFR